MKVLIFKRKRSYNSVSNMSDINIALHVYFMHIKRPQYRQFPAYTMALMLNFFSL